MCAIQWPRSLYSLVDDLRFNNNYNPYAAVNDQTRTYKNRCLQIINGDIRCFIIAYTAIAKQTVYV